MSYGSGPYGTGPYGGSPALASPDSPSVSFEVNFAGPTTGLALLLDDETRGRLDTNTLGAAESFVDIHDESVRSWSSRRGSTRVDGPVIRYEAGTLSASLHDPDRRFDPDNLDGPYVSAGRTQVEPMRAVRIRATYNGVTYDLWRGFADNWARTYVKTRDRSPVELTATDGFKVFSNIDRAADSPVGAGEDTGARIERILDSAGWDGDDRDIATGDTTVQATTLDGDALTEAFLTADTELGEFYMNAEGKAYFRNRLALLEDERSTTPVAYFGDGENELPYFDLIPGNDDEGLANLVRIARAGGTQQEAEDSASQARYLIRTYERTDLLMETDAEAGDYVDFVLYQSKDAERRFAELGIKPDRDPANLYPHAFGREIGDRIRITLRPEDGDPIVRDCFIRGIAHEVTPSTWVTRFTLQSATKYAFLVLDNADLGELDANALAF